jgi:hypothetical protein
MVSADINVDLSIILPRMPRPLRGHHGGHRPVGVTESRIRLRINREADQTVSKKSRVVNVTGILRQLIGGIRTAGEFANPPA